MDRTESVEDVGEILKSLNPTAIAVLLFVIDDTIDKQVEMAERLDCTSAPVSLSLKSLSEISEPLVERNRDYRITPTGQEVISRVDEMMLAIGVDLCEIDWRSDEDKAAVDTALRPLHNSRSLMPFYVLNSISRLTDLGSPESIKFNDIVNDVKSRKLKRGESVTRRQVKHAVDRFEKEDVVTMPTNKNNVDVTEKGRQQARLFNRLVDLLSDNESKHGAPVTDQSDREKTSFHIPPRITIGELSDHVQRLEEQYGRDEVLELRWSLTTKVNASPQE